MPGAPPPFSTKGRRDGCRVGERRHQLPREPAQSRASAGAVEPHVLGAGSPQGERVTPTLIGSKTRPRSSTSALKDVNALTEMDVAVGPNARTME